MVELDVIHPKELSKERMDGGRQASLQEGAKQDTLSRAGDRHDLFAGNPPWAVGSVRKKTHHGQVFKLPVGYRGARPSGSSGTRLSRQKRHRQEAEGLGVWTAVLLGLK